MDGRSAPTVEPLEARIALAAQAYPVVPVGALNPTDTQQLIGAGGVALVATGEGLVRSDGSAAGTEEINPAQASTLYEWHGGVYLSDMWDGNYARTMVRLDPATGRTTPVLADGAVVMRGNSFVDAGDKLFFSGVGTPQGEYPLYVTDGTNAGTHHIGTGRPLGMVGGRLLFVGFEFVPGQSRWSLWETDGTTVRQIDPTRGALTYAGTLDHNTLVYGGWDGLFKTDGTAAGTVLLEPGLNNVSQWFRAGDALYFGALDPNNNTWLRLWKTDGTAAGTVPVEGYVLPPGDGFPDAPSMVAVGDVVYFVGRNLRAYGPQQVYSIRPDGTITQVTDVGTDAATEGIGEGPSVTGGRIYFGARDTGEPAHTLWSTDGTPGAERPVPGSTGAPGTRPMLLAPVGGSLFYVQQTVRGDDGVLWRYAVTPAALDEDGALVVDGTDPAEGDGVSGNDTISVSATGDTITATVNGQSFDFPAAAVRRITVNALGGDDALTVSSAVDRPLTYNASGGDESFTVEGAEGDDAIAIGDDQVVVGSRTFTFHNLEGLIVRSLGGNDRITVDGTPAPEVIVHAGDGDESVQVRTVNPDGYGGLSGRLSVDGGAGVNTLRLDDTNRRVATRYALAESSLAISAGPDQPPITFSNFGEGVALAAGAHRDVIRVTPGEGTPLSVDGGSPTGLARDGGDAIAIDLSGGAAGGRLELSPTEGGRYVFDNRRPVTFGGVEVLDNFQAPSALEGRLLPGQLARGRASVAVRFDEPVVLPLFQEGTALQLTNLDTGQAILPVSISGSADATTREAVFTASLPGGRFRATIAAGAVTDFAGNPTASDFTFEFVVAPRIDVAWADGSGWSPAFRARFPGGFGRYAPGVSLYSTPPAQPVAWAGINRFFVQFNGPVEVDAADLVVRGVSVPSYAVSDFSYDPATYTAVWTLAQPVDVDKVSFLLDGHSAAGVRGTGPGVAPGSGPLMDGENTTPVSFTYPTGDGSAGGDFRARLDVLVGNASLDGVVNALDLAAVRQRLNTVAPPPGQPGTNYRYQYDVIPDGRINALDMAAVRRRLGSTLPNGNPAAAPAGSALAPTAAPSPSPSPSRTATRLLFADAPIL